MIKLVGGLAGYIFARVVGGVLAGRASDRAGLCMRNDYLVGSTYDSNEMYFPKSKERCNGGLLLVTTEPLLPTIFARNPHTLPSGSFPGPPQVILPVNQVSDTPRRYLRQQSFHSTSRLPLVHPAGRIVHNFRTD